VCGLDDELLPKNTPQQTPVGRTLEMNMSGMTDADRWDSSYSFFFKLHKQFIGYIQWQLLYSASDYIIEKKKE
jgi:hypothetical protein